MTAQQARYAIDNIRRETRNYGYAVEVINWVSLECVAVNDFQVEWVLTDLDNPRDYIVCETFEAAVWLLTIALTVYVN